jgi:hypothetical protein
MTPVMTFQRKGWRLAPWYATEAFFWCFAAVSLLVVLIGLFGIGPLKPADYLFVAACFAALVWVPATYAWNLRRWIRRVRTYYVRIDAPGVEFHLPGTGRTRLSWEEIRAVTSEKRWVRVPAPMPVGYKNIFYTMEASNGRVTFSQMEIPGAKRAAREIAARLKSNTAALSG